MSGAFHQIRKEHYVKGAFHPNAADTSTPKFAHDDEHVAAVMAQRGFCALSERRIGLDGVRVCLPLVWPLKARQDVDAWNRIGRTVSA